MHMKLVRKFHSSLRVKTQLLKRLLWGVYGATHYYRDGVEGNRGSLKVGAEAFMLFLCGAQLILQLSVLTVLDFDEVDVTLESAEIFGSVLSGEGGSAGCGWRVAEVFLISLSCPLPLLRTYPSSLLVCCFFVFAEMGQHPDGGGKPFFV